jgi:predicted alpha/beta superfamily hydrolase
MRLVAAFQIVLWANFLASRAFADGEPRQALPFCHTQDVGVGRSIFVVGGHPDLGNWAPTGAVRLRYTAGNVWTGQVAVRSGESFEFKYIHRSTATNQICDPANVTWISPANLATATMSIGSAPYAGKTVYYYSSWTQAFLLASTDGVSFADVPLTPVGAGRVAGEFLYRVTGVGSPGGTLEFVVHNGAGLYDKSPYAGYGDMNYFTRLDAFVLQDGQLYNYWPASSVSAPRIATNFINSTAPDGRVSGRVARIYLPRGYDEHAGKRYPVMYFHDGQNVFEDSKSSSSAANSWQIDRTATREISQGRMRECILVGLDNTGSRQFEYEVPGDTYPGQPAGIGDSYLYFLLNNVRPTLDFNFRTLTDPRNTLVGGSSMGGLISIYTGYETNVFGGVLAMSPALTRATNFTAALWSRMKRPLRIYIDTGTAEGQVGPLPGGDYWTKPQEGYDIFLSHGYAVNADLLWQAGCEATHNELAWRARVPGALAFLLDVREEPQTILASEIPPRLAGIPTGTVSTATLRQQIIRFDWTTSMDPPDWQPLATSAVERLPWGTTTFTSTPAASAAYLRAVAIPMP